MSKPYRQNRRGRGQSSPKRPALPKDSRQVIVDHIGAKGDGIARDDAGQAYYVPYGAAQDHLTVNVTDKRGDHFVGTIQSIDQEGPSRQAAPCPHYERCGGCQLQHIDPEAYQAWTQDQVYSALAHQGLEPQERVDPVFVEAGQRRRVAFGVMKKGKKIVFGLNARGSHRLEEIDHCLLLEAPLNKLIAPLRAAMGDFMKDEGRGDVVINAPDGSIDLVFMLPNRPDLKVHQAAVEFAQAHDIQRISWQDKHGNQPEILLERSNVIAHFGADKVPVALPPAPFLQPSKAGEQALAGFVRAYCGSARKTLDLYAGCGSFTFVLAEQSTVHAVEANGAALKALERSAGHAGIGGQITTETRDLSRQPLMDKELEDVDLLVFDPPRAGAKEQAAEIAKSPIPVVIAISCNPSTFARDARTLVDGGYRLDAMMPVDQFTWSTHVEVAAVFKKEEI